MTLIRDIRLPKGCPGQARRGSEGSPPLQAAGLCVTFLRSCCRPVAGWRAEPSLSTAWCAWRF